MIDEEVNRLSGRGIGVGVVGERRREECDAVREGAGGDKCRSTAGAQEGAEVSGFGGVDRRDGRRCVGHGCSLFGLEG